MGTSKIAVLLSHAQDLQPETNPRNAELISILRQKMEVEIVCSDPRQPGASLWSFFRAWVRETGSPAANLALELRARAERGKFLWIPDGAGSDCLNLIPLARVLGYQVILDKNELEFLRNPLTSARRDRSEGRDCRGSHAVVAASRLSASRLQKIAPRSTVHVIPHPIDCDAYSETRATEGDCLLFGGRLDSDASAEGLLWFLREVMPRLRNALGDNFPRILVPVPAAAGAEPVSELAQRTRRMLEFSGVELVEHGIGLAGLLAQARIVFVPTRESAEARFPILEAMAAGRAVIATGQSAQGLAFSPSYDLWIADQPDNFATGLLRLLSEAEFRGELGSHAAEAVERNHGRERVSALVDQLIGSFD